MKKLFVAIRQSDLEMVKALLNQKPELISCTAKQPPKKDHGQSPLQVAIKSGNFAIADYLLDKGADVNFMETESAYEWRAPVLHDAITATVMSSRFSVRGLTRLPYEVQNSKEKADAAFHILNRMLEMKAAVNTVDSYGNSSLGCAISDARQILPSYIWQEDKIEEDGPYLITKELVFDLSRIFQLLIKNGADIKEIDRNFKVPLDEHYKEEPVAQFLV